MTCSPDHEHLTATGDDAGATAAARTTPQTTAPVLVTGATGKVGSQIVELLLAAGVTVRAAASSVEAVRARFDDRVEAVAADFTDPATWQEAYSGVHRMFLMRPPHLGKPKKQMLPSLEAAKTRAPDAGFQMPASSTERSCSKRCRHRPAPGASARPARIRRSG